MADAVVNYQINGKIQEAYPTTVDNPYNPFTHWKEWNNYDVMVGKYNTLSWWARLAEQRVNDSMTDDEQILENNRIILRMTELLPETYRLVYPDSEFLKNKI